VVGKAALGEARTWRCINETKQSHDDDVRDTVRLEGGEESKLTQRILLHNCELWKKPFRCLVRSGYPFNQVVTVQVNTQSPSFAQAVRQC
jgi:hypothetical protein